MMVVSKSENNLSSSPCQIETNIYRLHIQKTGSAEYLCEISKNAAIAADHGRLNSYEKLASFIEYASKLKGYEKGEAQLFLDRLFIAFGNKGITEAEASLESPIKIDSQTAAAHPAASRRGMRGAAA